MKPPSRHQLGERESWDNFVIGPDRTGDILVKGGGENINKAREGRSWMEENIPDFDMVGQYQYQ